MKRWSYTPQPAHKFTAEEVWKRLRRHDITSTESATLFDMSPYATRFQLFQQKKSLAIVEIEENLRMRLGKKFERYTAEVIAEEHGIKIRKVNRYMRLIDVRMGASFDYEIIGLVEPWAEPETALREMYRKYGTGNLEIKCVDWYIFKDRWPKHDDGSIEAPAHIEVQVQHQLHVSDRSWAALGILVGGNQTVVVIRQRFSDVGASIENRVREFWKSIRDNNPPEPSYPIDAEFVKKLYGYAEPNRLFDAGALDDFAEIDDGNGGKKTINYNPMVQLADQYSSALSREKLAKEDKVVAQAKIYAMIGEAERVVHPKFSMWTGSVGPSRVEAYDRDGYRGFKLTPKKEKKTNG